MTTVPDYNPQTAIETIGDLKRELAKSGKVYASSAFTRQDVHYVQVVKTDLIREIAHLDDDILITADRDRDGAVWLG